MAFEQPIRTHDSAITRMADIDAGLRSYMLRVYNYMALGVALTGIITLYVASNPEWINLILSGPIKIVLFLAILGLGFFSGKIMTMQNVATAHLFYWSYAALWGVMMAPMIAITLQSTQGAADVARAFFITAAMFAGTSIFGYVTKRNLSAFASFFVMASIGLLVAMLVNAFLVQSSGFSLLTSIGAVLLFSGVTAYETQLIKNMYHSNHGEGVVTRMAIFGAFQLYGNFVVLFIHILNILRLSRD